MRAWNNIMAAAFAAAEGPATPPAGAATPQTADPQPPRAEHRREHFRAHPSGSNLQGLHAEFMRALHLGQGSEIKANILGRLATESIADQAVQNVPGFLAGQAAEGGTNVQWKLLDTAKQVLTTRPDLQRAFYVEIGAAIGMLERAPQTANVLKGLASLRDFQAALDPPTRQQVEVSRNAYLRREAGAMTAYEALLLENTGNPIHSLARREHLVAIDGNAARIPGGTDSTTPRGKFIRPG